MASIVLLPGMDGSGSLFGDIAASLAPELRATVISYPADRPLNYAELREFVAASLPTDRPYVLLAESFSGPIAIEVAASRPKGLRALILVCTFARAPIRIPKWLHAFFAAAPVWMAPNALLGAMLFQSGRQAGIAQKLSAAMSAVPPQVWRSRLKAVLGADTRQCLQSINVPTLCLRARQDRLLPRSASRPICAGIPDVKLEELEGPHFLLQTRPDEAAACIRRFVGSLPAV